jgi:hypothetical protein
MTETSVQRRLGWALATAAALGMCPAASAVTDPDDVLLRFDNGTVNSRITAVANAGTAVTRQRIVTQNGGFLVARWSRTGRFAADYPAFDGSTRGPRAVVAVTNAGATDALSPGAASFAFGADVRRDPVSTGTPSDNGNNVVQRGLFGDVAQFKVQLDNGHPLCRVKGDLGVLSVNSRLFLRSNTWYRIICVRQVSVSGDHLALTVAPVRLDGTPGPAVSSSSAVLPVGDTGFSYDTPLSVGGKLNPNLTIVAASDQFNGWIDNAFLRIP